MACPVRAADAAKDWLPFTAGLAGISMLTRRHVLLAPLAQASGLAARPTSMSLCLHQTTSAAAGYRKSLEGSRGPASNMSK